MKTARLIAMFWAGIVVFYPLSMGPAFRFVIASPSMKDYSDRGNAFQAVYSPFLWLSAHNIDQGLVDSYLKLWRPSPETVPAFGY